MTMKLILLLLSIALASAKECGVKPNSYETPRIVGGVNAQKGEFPWQVSWRFSQNPGTTADRHICGGSILNENWILTAAHCVDINSNGVSYRDPKYFKALVGEHNLQVDEPEERKIQIKEIVIHPNWDSSTINNDIALARLETPLNFNGNEKHLTPICVGDSRLPNLDDRSAVNSGWGLTQNGNKTLPDILQKVGLTVTKQSTCRSAYIFVNTITDGMICAGDPNGGKSPCNGDSGGPLSYQHSDGKIYQVGVVSWGLANGCGRKGYPGVFARVTQYADFIKKTAGITY